MPLNAYNEPAPPDLVTITALSGIYSNTTDCMDV